MDKPRRPGKCSQYIGEYTEKEARKTVNEYFDGKPGEKINPDSLDTDIPLRRLLAHNKIERNDWNLCCICGTGFFAL